MSPPPRRGRKINYINKCYKYTLFLSNFIFWISGIAFTIVGITAFVLSGGLPQSANASPLQWLFNLTIVLIGLGSVIIIVSFAGCIGSLRENICLLKFYAWVLLIMFLSECTLAILAFVYRSKAVVALEDVFREAFIKQYWEIGFEDTTNLVDWIQKEMECCGPEKYEDWNINRYYSCLPNNTSPTSCGVPYSCCRKMNNIDENVINTACGYSVQMYPLSKATSIVWTNGCVKSTVNFIVRNIYVAAGVIIGIAILQLVAVFLSRVLAGQINDQIRLLDSENRRQMQYVTVDSSRRVP